MTERLLAAAVITLSLAGPAHAAEKLDAGPNPDTAYVTTAHAAQRFESKDGRVAVQQDNIATLICPDCVTPMQMPGLIYHARNLSKKPVCFMLDMRLDETRPGQLVEWGANKAHYLKPGEWYFKIIGVTHSLANRESADLGWRGGIKVWDPVRSGGCTTP
jgi:hypothetical protein